jgi:hypothetical protein
MLTTRFCAKNLPLSSQKISKSGARSVVDPTRKDPFAHHPSGPDITRFVSVLHDRPRECPPLPLNLPSADEWLLKITAIQNQFVLGIYKREMKAIGYLGKIERILSVPATTRSWNTIEKVVKILGPDSQN